MESYDVIVVGAGPAGLSATYELVKSNIKVLLIEKLKDVGGTYKSWVTYPDIVDEFDLKRCVLNEFYTLTFDLPSVSVSANCFDVKNWRKKKLYGILISPEKFGEEYKKRIKRKGGMINLSETVSEVKKNTKEVIIKTNENIYKSEILIDASGSECFVGKKLRLVPDKNFLCFKCFGKNIINASVKDEHEMAFFFHGAEVMGGWYYTYSGKEFDLGAANYSLLRSDPPFPLKGAFKYMLNLPFIKEKLKRKPVFGKKKFLGTIRSEFQGKIFTDRVLLVGESAGQNSPFVVEGFRPGLHYGKLAARAVINAFDSNDFSEKKLSVYWRLCDRNRLFDFRVHAKIRNKASKFNKQQAQKVGMLLRDTIESYPEFGFKFIKSGKISFVDFFKLLSLSTKNKCFYKLLKELILHD